MVSPTRVLPRFGAGGVLVSAFACGAAASCSGSFRFFAFPFSGCAAAGFFAYRLQLHPLVFFVLDADLGELAANVFLREVHHHFCRIFHALQFFAIALSKLHFRLPLTLHYLCVKNAIQERTFTTILTPSKLPSRSGLFAFGPDSQASCLARIIAL